MFILFVFSTNRSGRTVNVSNSFLFLNTNKSENIVCPVMFLQSALNHLQKNYLVAPTVENDKFLLDEYLALECSVKHNINS